MFPKSWNTPTHMLLIWVCTSFALFTVTRSSAQTVTVTTSADVVDVSSAATISDLPGPDGVVSFREALLVTDNEPGHQTIGFEIPEHDWYLPNIFPGQVLLQGSFSWSASDSVTIDGTTQTAFTGDTFPDGNEVVLYGLSTYLGGDGTVVTGLHDSRVEVSGSASEIYGNTGSMYIALYFGSGSVIHDNEAGTIKIDQSNDNVIIRNTTTRVRIDGWFGGGAPATNNRIGGPDAADRNFITGYGSYGQHGVPRGTTVELFDTVDTLIENNYIGTTPDGMSIGNNASRVGIGIESKNHNLTIRNNLIATRAVGVGPAQGVIYGQPIYIEAYGGYDGFTENVEILGNTLGLNAHGQPLLGGVNGILVSTYAQEYAFDLRIGGPEPGQGNMIAGHESYGILIEGPQGIEPAEGVGIRVSGNSIYGNGDIGIDLIPNNWTFGPTPNDPLDADVGANWLQNYPDIVSATNNGQTVQIAGQFHSEPLKAYTLEFFASAECDPTGFGPGQMYLGSTSIVTDANGDGAFDVSLAASVEEGWVATATATQEPIGATSEFSACVNIESSAPDVPALPEGIKLADGVIVAGQMSDLFASDDQYLEVDPSPTKNLFKQKIHLIVQSTCTTSTPTGFSFKMESRMLGGPAGDVLQTIELLNYRTEKLELLDARAAAISDDTVHVSPEGDLSRFVQPLTNEITATVTWKSEYFAGPPFRWSVDVDEAIWMVAD